VLAPKEENRALTWPVGVWVISYFIKIGYERDPYALSVIEMGVMLFYGLQMIFAFVYLFSSVKKPSPVLHAIWYGLRVSLAAFVCVSIVPATYLPTSGGIPYLEWSFILLVTIFTLFGTLCAYQRVRLGVN